MISLKICRDNVFKIFVGITILALLLVTGASATTITANTTGWGDDTLFNASSTPIQSAIDNATAGDTINVSSGTYLENVNVTKQLTLNGIGMPVVNASGSGSAITLSADGIILEGFTATGAGASPNAGIKVNSSNNTLIGNNASSNYHYGIYLLSSSNNTLNGNNASSNGWDGIHLYSSSNNNTISGSNVTSNSKGIYLSYSSNNNTISGNNASSNTNYGILLSSSSNNTLSGNNASLNHWDGILLSSSSNNTLSGNNVTSNDYGIVLDSFSNNNTLSGNNANSNTENGIYLDSSSNNTIYNNIFNNTDNVEFVGSNNNTWNITNQTGINIINGSYLGGNFWAYPNGTGFSQTCADTNVDGICDSVYDLDSNNIDYLPLAANTSSTNTPVHNINNTLNYTTIQAAINDANPGDEIRVDNGTYYENVNVNRQLILRGIGNPVVDAGGSGNAITLSENGTTLEGFTATGHGYGIYVTSNNNTLTGNNASNNYFGILLNSSSNNTLGDNIVWNNSYGILLNSSSNNTIYNNIFNNTDNVEFVGSNNNTWNITNQTGINIIGGPNLGGNFWANPTYYTGFGQTCADVNHNGICDLNYTLDASNIDYLPLTYLNLVFVTRTLPESVVPGGTFEVNITPTNQSQHGGYEIEETFPAGFTFVSTSAYYHYTNTSNPRIHIFIQTNPSSFTYNLTAPTLKKSYTIYGNFTDEDLATGPITPSVIVVMFKPLNVTLSPANVIAFTPANVSFNISYGGVPISDANVTLSGKAIGSSITNATGIAVINVSATGEGTITVTASMAGYTNKTATITALPKKPSISATPPTVTAFDPTYVTFNITYEGAQVPGARVTLTGKTATVWNTTNETGITVINVTANGAGNITATVNMTNYTSNIATITVSPKPLIITANPETILSATPTNVSFTVRYGELPIDNATVVLTGRASGSKKTNSDGIAVISITATGAGDITATASKTNFFTSATETITVSPKNLDMSASLINVSAFDLTPVSFTVTYNELPVDNATVTLTGKATGSKKTNSDGIAVINITATGAGSITATASMTGCVSDTTIIYSSAKLLNITTSLPNVTAGNATDVTFNVTLVVTGAPVPGANVTLSGKAIGNGTTNDSGLVVITITAAEAGNITATARLTNFTSANVALTADPYSSHRITKQEMIQAVIDYFDGLRPRAQVFAMLIQYFNGS